MPSFFQGPRLKAKLLTISAIGMGVGFGSCGFVFLTSAGVRSPPFLQSVAVYGGAALFFISLAIFVITVLAALANWLGLLKK